MQINSKSFMENEDRKFQGTNSDSLQQNIEQHIRLKTRFEQKIVLNTRKENKVKSISGVNMENFKRQTCETVKKDNCERAKWLTHFQSALK